MNERNIGLIWIGGIGLPAIAMALGKVDNSVWGVLCFLAIICFFTTGIILAFGD